MDLTSYLNERRRLIERALAGYLDRLADQTPRELLEAMRYSLLAPGKRLRPILVLMAAEACGSQPENALPAACAIELVHTYSLVHDDLPAMDDDDLRRGQPTCHKKFGEATAILVGDALLTLGFQVLSEMTPATVAAAGCSELAQAAGAAGMVGGQADDLAWARAHPPSPPLQKGGTGGVGTDQENMLQSLHSRKTGALFRAAVRMGAVVARAATDIRMRDALDRYADALGLAFQISDDLLDVEGNAGDTGKRVQKDAGRGKLTYPGVWGIERSRQRLHDVCGSAIEALAPLGDAAQPLVALVELIEKRDR